MHFAIGMTVMSIVLTAVNASFLHLANKQKRKQIAEGAPDRPELGDRNPHFLYYI
jgi:hypothetical protein